MAYPGHRIGIEYEVADHSSREGVLRDVASASTRWYGEPEEIAANVRRARDGA
jgi:hypothetical protein